jgi:hypothetical protein
MKRLSILLGIGVIALFTQAHSCNHHNHNECSGEIICTEIFAMVTVQVKDTNGNAVALDEYYTIREKTGEKLPKYSNGLQDGTYPVVDDNFIGTLKKGYEGLRFVGKKNGVEVVNEIYEVEGDCCHVNKRSGKETVIVQ